MTRIFAFVLGISKINCLLKNPDLWGCFTADVKSGNMNAKFSAYLFQLL